MLLVMCLAPGKLPARVPGLSSMGCPQVCWPAFFNEVPRGEASTPKNSSSLCLHLFC